VDGDVDWKFSAEQIGWGNNISQNFGGDCISLSDASEVSPFARPVQTISFDYSSARDLDVRANVVVKNNGTSGGKLNVSIGSQSCELIGITNQFKSINNCKTLRRQTMKVYRPKLEGDLCVRRATRCRQRRTRSPQRIPCQSATAGTQPANRRDPEQRQSQSECDAFKQVALRATRDATRENRTQDRMGACQESCV